MKNKKGLLWLYGELPELISKGIISTDTAESIKKHYGIAEANNWKQVILTVFGVLGAVFVGLGLILLIANNWAELSRPARTVISLAPLFIAQLLAGFTLWKKYDSVAWREGSSIFLMSTIGASISLISQTYHLSGDWQSFLLMWMLLSLPLVYILKSALVAFFYLIGITVWGVYEFSNVGQGLLFWPLVFLLFPEFGFALKENPYSNRAIFFSWALTVCLCFGIGLTLEETEPVQWIIVYSSYFSSLYLAGHLWFDKTTSFWLKPFQNVGSFGLLVLSYILTYNDIWKEISRKNGYDFYSSYEWHSFSAFGLFIVFFLFSLVLMVNFARKGKLNNVLFSSLFLLTTLCYLFTGLKQDTEFILINVLLFNLYLFFLGIITIAVGIKGRQMGTVNSGMLMISLLILLRFFDMEIEFVVKGIIFILIGIAFFVTNFLIVRGLKSDENE